MRFKCSINKVSTFFHFLDSISNWDIHTRESVRKYYFNKYPLTEKDKEMLDKYVQIREKYPWGELDSDFYTSQTHRQVIEKLKQRLSIEELKIMHEIINYFDKNIEEIYKEHRPYLLKMKKLLGFSHKSQYLEAIFREVQYLLNTKTTDQVTVHLLVNPSMEKFGVGANIKPRTHITVEPINDESESNLKHIRNVIVHEILHLVTDNDKKYAKIFQEEISNSDLAQQEIDILNEAILDTIAPHGIIEKKKENTVLQYKDIQIISKEESKKKYYHTFRNKLSAHIYPLTAQYFKKKLNLDRSYLKKSIKVLQNLR